MQIGPRNWRITILQSQTTNNSLGETIATGWEDYAKPWAAYVPVSDGERLRAAAVEQQTDARFQVLWSDKLAGITGAHRLRFDGDVWQITGIKTIGFRHALELTAWRIKKGEPADVG